MERKARLEARGRKGYLGRKAQPEVPALQVPLVQLARLSRLLGALQTRRRPICRRLGTSRPTGIHRVTRRPAIKWRTARVCSTRSLRKFVCGLAPRSPHRAGCFWATCKVQLARKGRLELWGRKACKVRPARTALRERKGWRVPQVRRDRRELLGT